MDRRKPKPVTCKRCARQVLRPPGSLYCEECSAIASKESRTHERRDPGRNRQALEKAGQTFSDDTALSFATPSPPDYLWITRFYVPFSYAASKNHIYGWGHHIHKRAESRAMQDAISIAAKVALRGHTVVHNKLWVGMWVEKPNHKGDAVNVVDLVCDGIKAVVPMDDNWFSLSFVDWTINKRNPKLIIQIGQDSDEDVQACSCCGRILTFDCFWRHKQNKNGIARVCKECRSLAAKIGRKEARAA